MRLHVVGLPHTETARRWDSCAYTGKVRRFCQMMHGRGHEVYLYAGDANEAPCTEHVCLVEEEERERWFGPFDPNALPTAAFDAAAEPWQVMNQRAAAAIRERAEPRDFVCLIGGCAQQPIAAALPDLMSVEFGVGYPGIFAPYCAFESYAWMHHVYGQQHIEDGRWFDAVVQNYFDPADFPIQPSGASDYLLFIGRLVARKGPQLAAEIAKESGMRLLVAGQGAREVTPGRIVADEVTLEGDHIEYIGPVDAALRNRLMAGARAVLVPTQYIEPFGGVAVEAQMAGTPVITTDWGAFTETVDDGRTGFRCRTMAEFVRAVQRVPSLYRGEIRQWALGRYSLEAVAPRYEAWFGQLMTLWGDGFYARATA